MPADHSLSRALPARLRKLVSHAPAPLALPPVHFQPPSVALPTSSTRLSLAPMLLSGRAHTSLADPFSVTVVFCCSDGGSDIGHIDGMNWLHLVPVHHHDPMPQL